jgi:actin
MIQIQFETFQVPFFYFAFQGLLWLYASGRWSGIVVDVGDGVTQVVPLYQYYPARCVASRQNFAGRDLTDWLEKMLNARSYTFENPLIVRDMKEKVCSVAQDDILPTDANVSYSLENGSEVVVGNERFRCPELLFQPTLNNLEFLGIHKLLSDVILRCSADFRKDLYAGILVSGGCTMFDGFPERLAREIGRLAPPATKVKIVAPAERKDGVWVGGSICASLCTFPQLAISRQEYNDAGVAIVHQRCA